MKRETITELLDTDSGSPSEVAASLRDLEWFNRWFGGVSTSAALVEHVARKTGLRSLTLLEVASGAGYVPATVAQKLRPLGIEVQTVLLDRVLSHIQCGHRNGTRATVGDALSLPFADDSFDVVSSSLFTHHLSPDELTRFVNEGLRVCRIAVIINDLVRDPLHLATVYAGVPLYRSRITRHDAPASVRQAYTEAEMREILSATLAKNIEIERHYFYRMGIVAWK
jgi:ubiquinone/menaquinone biosynthesis C-methylase UbiE